MFRAPLLSCVILAIAMPAVAAEKTVRLTGENCKIEFVGAKPDGKHTGGFKTLSGTATCDPADPTTIRFRVEIDTASLYSDDEKLTAHLKAPDFFNVRKYPKATFETTKVEKTDTGIKVTGELTMLDVSKPVSFPAKLDASGEGLKFSSQFEIDRTQFGMEYGKGKINDQVLIKVTIAAAN